MLSHSLRIRLLIAASALLTAAPLAAQALTPPTAPAAPADVPDADPALWVMRDADTTIYLFGTMHVLRANITWFDDAVAEALAASSELRIEMIMPENPAELGPLFLAAAQNGSSAFSTRMTTEQRTQYVAAMERLNVPWQRLEGFDGWFVSLQMAQAMIAGSGLTPASGAEATLIAAARARNVPITAFETPGDQIGALDSVPESEQIVGLLQMLGDLPAGRTMLNAMVTAWSTGDAESTGNLITETRTVAPELHRIIFIDRNRRWADNLAARMAQPGTMFVAVGAGHLAGDNSVQDLLTQRGFTVTRVAY